MKKGFATVILICAPLLLFGYFIPTGNTQESREHLLDTSIAKGKGWIIAAETELEGSIVSAATSGDNWATLASLSRQTGADTSSPPPLTATGDEIVISGAMLEDSWYDLIWFGGAQTEYAEITYTINGQLQEPLWFDTTDMEIISIQNPEKEYGMQIVYYDSDGNRYE